MPRRVFAVPDALSRLRHGDTSTATQCRAELSRQRGERHLRVPRE